jgi:hypothetical protein
MKPNNFGGVPTGVGGSGSGGGTGGSAGGDLSGTLPGPTVTGIDGSPLAAPGTAADGDTLVFDAGAGEWAYVPAAAPSPLTTKGDLWGYGTLDARVPVGTNGYPLIAASAVALGVQYGAITVVAAYPFHSESLTDGASNFIFAGGDVVTVVGVPN